LRAAIGKLERPFLHATRLGFTHPLGAAGGASGQVVEFSAPLPDGLQNFLSLVRGLSAD
jgi:hypothetical protein